MDASMEYCRKNKPELYQLADEQKLRFMPGIDEPFDVPQNAIIYLEPNETEQNCNDIIDLLAREKLFPLD